MFDSSTVTLNFITADDVDTSFEVASLDLSSDSKHIAIVGDSSNMFVYAFDRCAISE